MEAIKVLLVDDHTLFRQGVGAVLAREENLKVVGEASAGFEAIQMVKESSPDVVLMDLMMPNCTGLEATAALQTISPEVNILILSVSEKEDDLFSAINLGAKGYLLKNSEPEELVQAVYHIARGGVIVSAPLAEKLRTQFKGGSGSGVKEEPVRQEASVQLSRREDEVLQLVAEGASNKQIASALIISENTVKAHLRHIMDRLHLVNRSQAAAYAIKMGIARNN